MLISVQRQSPIEALAHVFSCEFCKITKNFPYRTPPAAASVNNENNNKKVTY